MSEIQSYKVFSPATVANVGSGYDIFSLAINEPGDIIEFIPNELGVLRIENRSRSFLNMPLNPDENATTVPMALMLKDHQITKGFDVVFHQKIRPGSGLGSSAASSVAGVFYLNKVLQLNLSSVEQINYAREGERVACGSPIADNVAACLNGGFNLIRSQDPLEVFALNYPKDLYLACVHPELEILTSESRAILPKEVSLKSAVEQNAQSAALVAGMASNNLDLISKGTTDILVEPHRKKLIKGFDELKKIVLANGGMNCSISGAGPSLFSFCRNHEVASLIATEMNSFFNNIGITSDVYISTINTDGIKVM
ncbi:MAG: homoserine kinase [Bacteroidota bacterium]